MSPAAIPQIDAAQAPTPQPPHRRGISLLRWGLRVLFYLPLLLLLSLALLVGTGPGTQVTLQLAAQFVPGLQLHYQQGTLNRALQLRNVHWRMHGLAVQIDRFDWQWRPTCLLQRQLCVDMLQAEGVTVSVHTDAFASDDAGDDKTSDTTTPLTLPLGLRLPHIQLQQLAVNVDDRQFRADNLGLVADWQQDGLTVAELHSEGLDITLPTTAADSTATPTATDAWPLAQLPQIRLPFAVNVITASLQNSTLHIDGRSDHLPQLLLQANMHDDELAIQQLAFSHDYGSAELNGAITFAEHYPLVLHAQATLQQVSELPGLSEQTIALSVTGDFAALSAELQLSGQQQASIKGKVDLTQATLPYEVQLQDGQLHWPLAMPSYQANQLQLHSQGSLQQQQLSLQGEFCTPWLKDIHLTLSDVNHVPQQLQIGHLTSSSALGKLAMSGNFAYDKGFRWQGDLQTDGLDLSQINLTELLSTPLPTSQISGSIAFTGDWQKDQWQLAFQQADLNGTIARTPFQLKGSLKLDNQQHLQADGVELAALNSTLSLQGDAGAKWDLSGKLVVPELVLLYPQAQGSLNLDLSVQGQAKQPMLLLQGQASQLRFQDIQLQQAQLQGRYQPLQQHQYSLTLSGQALSFAGEQLPQLTLESHGDLSQQQLTVNSSGDLALALQAENRYQQEKQQLQLRLTQLQLQSPLGQWQLQAPLTADWNINKQQGQLSAFCLRADSNQICTDNTVPLARSGQAALRYQGEPGKLLQALLPEGVRWSGTADMESDIRWFANKKPQAQLLVSLSPGRLDFGSGKDVPAPIDFDGGHIRASLDQQQLATEVVFTAGDVLQLNSQISVAVAPQHALQGHVRMQRINLKPLQRLFPQLATLQGNIDGDLHLSGTLADPQFSGQLQLAEGELVSSSNPTKVEQLQLALAFSGQQATVSGSWLMGDGKGHVSGNIQWPEGKFAGDLRLSGANLTLIQPPLAILQVSPELQLHFAPGQLALNGSVDIPTGNVTIMQLPDGGVSVSPDVVFEDTTAQTEARSVPLAISTDIALNVGSRLMIDGYGLKGQLSGTLRLQQQANRPVQLFGNIRVLNGSYKFMGQTLSITTGELQFAGPPSTPNLNVEAVREIKDEDVTAGIRVTGTPQRPVVTLFSNPAKEQAEILSYIAQGKGFDSSNSQNSSLMIGAAVSLGSQMTGGGEALSNIGNTAASLVEMFGFSNVQLDTNDEGKVAISGYLGKDLMLKYGVGVFNPGYEMTVRYYLLSQLYLESVSSTVGQSLDLYYSFDL